MKKINFEIAINILDQMPEEKKLKLRKILERNCFLTSAYVLEDGTITIYKEGFHLELSGCRSCFSIFAYDNDEEFVFTRKPRKEKLNKIYSKSLKFNESDYEGI